MSELQIPIPVVDSHTASWRALIVPGAAIFAVVLSLSLLVALVFTHTGEINRLRAQQAQIKAVSIAAAVQAAQVSCKNSNEVRSGTLDFVDTLFNNSQRTLQATLANPASTADAKATATANLQSIQVTIGQAAYKFAPKNCTNPLPLIVKP